MGNMFGFAPIVTRVAPTDTSATNVFGGAIVRVWGFTITNPSGGSVTATITTNETSPTTLFTALITTGGVVNVPIPFIADKGLKVTSSSANTLSFTFWHSQIGA